MAIGEVPAATLPLDFEQRREWSARLGVALGPAAPPIVVIWCQGQRGAWESPLAMLQHLHDFVERALQSDRAFLKLSAVIAIYPAGIDVRSVAPLNELSQQLAVYVLNGQTRLLAEGTLWQSAEIWPVAVGRLIGSLAGRVARSRGLRAWRCLAVQGSRTDSESIEVVASRMARSVISGIDGDAEWSPSGALERNAVSSVTETPLPLTPPDDRVSTDRVPLHCEDDPDRVAAKRPELPTWWECQPVDGISTIRGSVRGEVNERLLTGAGTRWNAVLSKRGRRFIRERFRRARGSAGTILGPRSVYTRAWARIHSTAALVGWHAKGAFFKKPSIGSVEVIARQRMAWAELQRMDESVVQRQVHALVCAKELDVARACSPSLLVRAMCVVAAAMFASGVVGTVTSSLRGSEGLKWGLATAIVAAFAGLLVGGAMFCLEWYCGERGRRRVEFLTRCGEESISDGFHHRLSIAAEGEVLHRRTAWLQSAARVRETADRLDVLMASSERRQMREQGDQFDPASPSEECVKFRDLTTVSLEPPITGKSLARTLLRRDTELLERERALFRDWWQELMRRLDPALGGGIVATDFSTAYAGRLDEMISALRSALSGEFSRVADGEWTECVGDQLGAMFGLGDDVPGLSSVTHRACGMERQRVVRVHAPTLGAANAFGNTIRRVLHGDCDPVADPLDTEAWGGIVLVVDEIIISLVPEARGVDGGVRVMEGGNGAD